MTDSGIPKPVAGADARLPQARAEQPVRVENATGDLARVPRTVRVEGTIVQHNDDGTVRISTPQGDLDVRLRGANDAPNGQKVEIDLSAGQPPRQAVVRVLPDQPPPAPQTPVSTATPPEANEPSVPPPLPLLSDELAAGLVKQAPPLPVPAANPPVAVQPGDHVRLVPLTAAEAAALVTEPALPATEPATASVQTFAPASFIFKATAAAVQNLRALITLPAQSAAVPRPPLAGFIPHDLHPPARPLHSLPVELEASAQPLEKAAEAPAPVAVRIIAVTPPMVKIGPPAASAFTMAPAAAKTPSPNPFFSTPVPATALEKAKAVHAGLPLPTAAPTPPAATAASLTATVAGKTAENFPVLSVTMPGQAKPVFFVLPVNAANLPAETTVSFIPDSTPAPADDNAAPDTQILQSAISWPAFDNIRSVAAQIEPHLAQVLPNAAAPAQITPAALFFVAAVRAGDVMGWLGDKTVDAVRRAGRDDLISRLSRDLDEAGRLDGAPKAADDWRALPLPMVAGGEIQRMMLYYRHDRGAKQGEGQDRPDITRFIFDMNLTRLGPVQVDGLHRPAAPDKKLDLIIRTQAPLSQNMQQSMRRAYVRALEETGHSGEMSFQSRAEQFIKVKPGARA